MWNHTVAILIGGHSRRMGSPKHLVELSNGKTMFEVMVLFATSTAKNVVIVGGDIEGYQCIHDSRDHQGPVAGIEELLKSKFDDRYLVVGCDMPLITPEIVSPLFCDDEAAVFSSEGNILGLPLMISSNVHPVCTAYLDSGGRSIKGLVAEIPHTTVSINETNASSLTSINTLDDLHNLSLK